MLAFLQRLDEESAIGVVLFIQNRKDLCEIDSTAFVDLWLSELANKDV